MSRKTVLGVHDIPADLAGRPGFLLRRAHQVAVAIFVEEAGHLSLTPPQHNVLSAINRFPGCSQSDVSRIVGYDRATIGAVLAGLETRRLLKRRVSRCDRRLKTLVLTRKGEELLKAITPVMRRINKRVLDPLLPDERQVFVQFLTKISSLWPDHEDANPEPAKLCRERHCTSLVECRPAPDLAQSLQNKASS